ncbi:MAG: helix-turn-helix domain-containing protein [Cypionkella sp.]|jgi:DNA-binding HxlR family transcriptional regulator
MKDLQVGHCPVSCSKVRGVLARVGDSWSVLVILALDGMGVMRFNELKRHLGISQRMLSLTLRELERDGMVRRTVFDSVPPRVEYELTVLGAKFADPIRGLGRWALDNLPAIDAARAEFDARV